MYVFHTLSSPIEIKRKSSKKLVGQNLDEEVECWLYLPNGGSNLMRYVVVVISLGEGLSGGKKAEDKENCRKSHFSLRDNPFPRQIQKHTPTPYYTAITTLLSPQVTMMFDGHMLLQQTG